MSWGRLLPCEVWVCPYRVLPRPPCGKRLQFTAPGQAKRVWVTSWVTVGLFVCLSVRVVLLASPAPPSQKQGPLDSALRPRSRPSRILLSENKNSCLVSRKLVRRRFEVLLLAEFQMKLRRRFLACKRKPKGL